MVCPLARLFYGDTSSRAEMNMWANNAPIRASRPWPKPAEAAAAVVDFLACSCRVVTSPGEATVEPAEGQTKAQPAADTFTLASLTQRGSRRPRRNPKTETRSTFLLPRKMERLKDMSATASASSPDADLIANSVVITGHGKGEATKDPRMEHTTRVRKLFNAHSTDPFRNCFLGPSIEKLHILERNAASEISTAPHVPISSS